MMLICGFDRSWLLLWNLEKAKYQTRVSSSYRCYFIPGFSVFFSTMHLNRSLFRSLVYLFHLPSLPTSTIHTLPCTSGKSFARSFSAVIAHWPFPHYHCSYHFPYHRETDEDRWKFAVLVNLSFSLGAGRRGHSRLMVSRDGCRRRRCRCRKLEGSLVPAACLLSSTRKWSAGQV